MLRKFFNGVIGLCLLGVVAIIAAMFLDTDIRTPPDQTAGYTTLSLPVDHRDVSLDVHVWYPTDAQTTPELLGQNALFYGHYVQRDAVPRLGDYPLIAVSHGSGGNAVQMGWLLEQLARDGYIVVAANHPGTTSRDSDPFRTPLIWERAQDIPAVITAIAGQGPLGLSVDTSRIGAMGFSLGGHTALAVSGVQVSKPAFIDYCDRHAGKVDCGWMQAAGVDFTTIDQARYEADYTDVRIKATVAIDPALPQAMTDSSLSSVTTKPLVINLGETETVPPAMRANAVAARMPDATYHTISGAWHFSFLTECSTLGRIVIGLAGDDNICSDAGHEHRADLHPEIFDAVSAYFARTLTP